MITTVLQKPAAAKWAFKSTVSNVPSQLWFGSCVSVVTRRLCEETCFVLGSKF